MNALLDAESSVPDFGAGRGQWAHDPMPATSIQLRSLHQRVRRVVGIDVEEAVLTNRTPHKWGVIGLGARSVPNHLHTRVLDRLQPGRKAEDVLRSSTA